MARQIYKCSYVRSDTVKYIGDMFYRHRCLPVLQVFTRVVNVLDVCARVEGRGGGGGGGAGGGGLGCWCEAYVGR